MFKVIFETNWVGWEDLFNELPFWRIHWQRFAQVRFSRPPSLQWLGHYRRSSSAASSAWISFLLSHYYSQDSCSSTLVFTVTNAHLWQTDGCSHTQSGHSPPAPLVPWSAQHRMIYIHLVIRKHLLLNFEGVPFRLFSHASSFDNSNILVLT